MKIYGFDVPEGKGYKWAAVDEDGAVCVFQKKPILDTSMEGEAFWNNHEGNNNEYTPLGYLERNPIFEYSLIELPYETHSEDATQALKTIQQALQGTYEEVMITRDEITVFSDFCVKHKGTPEQIVCYIENQKECARIVAEMAEN